MSNEAFKIPMSMPSIGDLEAEYAADAIASKWISAGGHFHDRFEAEFAQSCGASTALAVANGTVAVHLALAALGVGPGDEVIVPSLTYVAAVNAIAYTGATPVFVDVCASTWTPSPESISQAVSSRTAGILVVHNYGHPADMDPILACAKRHGLWVVEDAAEAPFARYRDRPVGSLADIATFSFYGNKIITSGEGGAVVTSDVQLAQRMELLRGQGMDPQRRYYFPVIGYNYRLTNVQAAILCAQLERRTELLVQRHRVARRYRAGLEAVGGVSTQSIAPWANWSPWIFSVVVDSEASATDRDQLMSDLAARGIDSRPFFIPVHTLPAYVEVANRQGHALPVTVDLAARGINLPTYPDLLDSDVDRVVQAVAESVQGRSV